MLLLLIVVAVILLAALAGLFTAYHKTYYSPQKDMSETEVWDLYDRPAYRERLLERTRRLQALSCEFVTIRSYDGLRLSARYYQGKGDKPLFICFHGYRGSPLKDQYGLCLHLIDEGYPVLSVDQRAHWRSGGHTITYGIRERRDVLSWIRYANTRFGTETPVYLFGISMGAATVIMATGQALPDNVRGVIADCPYNAPQDIIRYICRKIHLNPTLSWPVIWLSGLIYGRFRADKTTAAKEAKKSQTPILIIHGDGDDFVPPEMSAEIRDANPKMVERYTIAKAGHGHAYLYDPERYMEIVNDFLQRHP